MAIYVYVEGNMKLIKSKAKVLLFLMTMILVALLLALPTMAKNATVFDGVTIENGKVVGLNSRYGAAEYAYVTLESFKFENNELKAEIASGVTFTPITDNTVLTDNGVVCIRFKSAPASLAFYYIKGDDVIERSSISEYYEYKPGELLMPFKNSTGWFAGYWSNVRYITTSASPAVEGWQVNPQLQNNYASNPNNSSYKKALVDAFEAIKFRYAYLSKEMIPVDELVKFSFTTGKRQGSVLAINSASDKPIKGYINLYTMTDDGNLVKNTAKISTMFPARSTFNINVKKYFPNAEGYVMGIEISPYAELPDDVTFEIGPADKDGNRVSTNILIIHNHDGYVTKWTNDEILFPVQYNGVNTSYINGYADGSFRPNENITKAEISTILARLILGQDDIPRLYDSSFSDVTLNDWFYNAVTYLEHKGAYKYLSGKSLSPNEKITRGELAALIVHAAGMVEGNDKTPFVDVTEDHKYCKSISNLARFNIINGYEDGTFRPDALITRAEAVTLVNRLINLTVNNKTVVLSDVANTFNDVDGHWAKNNILTAANDNVKTISHVNHINTGKALTDNGETISFETKHVKITIRKDLAKITSIYNKVNGEDVLLTDVAPWFAYLTEQSGLTCYPEYAEIVDKRLKITFANGVEAYLIVSAFDNYFTIELDSDLPHNVKSLTFANFNITSEFSTTDPNTFRISSVAMTTSAFTGDTPGGETKRARGTAYSTIGNVIGAKVGVTFSIYGGLIDGAHRAYLKEICNAIDPEVGITSTTGGPFTLDEANTLKYGDYVIHNPAVTPDNAAEIAATASAYSLDIIDMMQGGSFDNGSFEFNNVSSAEEYKEKVSDVLHASGVNLSLHTYSALVSSAATSVLTNPKWQKQLAQNKEVVMTLRSPMAEKTDADKNKDGRILDYMYFTGNWRDEGWSVPYGGSNGGKSSCVFLVDEEIVVLYSDPARSDGTNLWVQRGQYGTKPAAHEAGAKVIQLYTMYGLQPQPGTELFYKTAEWMADAYNRADFDMIYLDGLEASMIFEDDSTRMSYYYAEFVRILVSNCIKKPVLEGSAMSDPMWAATGRPGAVDYASRGYKASIKFHVKSNVSTFGTYRTATLGWFNYGAGYSDAYINVNNKTLFRDDIDYLGTAAIAYNFSTTLQPDLNTTVKVNQVSENFQYYNVYSRLRKAGYFSPTVREALQDGFFNKNWEYKLMKEGDKWAFIQTYYESNTIRGTGDPSFCIATGRSYFPTQNPYFRIENRFSVLPNAAETTILELDNAKSVSEYNGYHQTLVKDISSTPAFKVKVKGNGSSNGGILISIREDTTTRGDRIDYFIPLNFTGDKEFILFDSDSGEYSGYTFDSTKSLHFYELYRNLPDMKKINYVQISTTGDCTNATIDDIRACTPVNAPLKNPSLQIGNNTMVFNNVTLNSGEYIEYIPEEDVAYHFYYVQEGSYKIRYAKPISYNGTKVKISAGTDTSPTSYSYTLGGVLTTDAPIRAKVTIGLKNPNNVLRNESSWDAPEVYIPEGTFGVVVKTPAN